MLFKLHSIRWFMKMSVRSLARQQSVFQQYHSENIYRSFTHKMAAKACWRRDYVTVTICIVVILIFFCSRRLYHVRLEPARFAVITATTPSVSLAGERQSFINISLKILDGCMMGRRGGRCRGGGDARFVEVSSSACRRDFTT